MAVLTRNGCTNENTRGRLSFVLDSCKHCISILQQNIKNNQETIARLEQQIQLVRKQYIFISDSIKNELNEESAQEILGKIAFVKKICDNIHQKMGEIRRVHYLYEESEEFLISVKKYEEEIKNRYLKRVTDDGSEEFYQKNKKDNVVIGAVREMYKDLLMPNI